MATSQEVKETYKSTLQDLTCNSKPLISVLTMLAEENVAHAKDIIQTIEEHLAKVPTDVKLPVLYLIDCIVKNVGGPYTSVFQSSLANMFTSVFQVVDEKTRMEMFKLRQTWNEVFSKAKLYALDVKTNQLDPAWPVTSAPPNIHFNPKFLNSTNAKLAAAKEAASTKPAITSNPTILPESTLDMQQKLIIKQKQLLELQQKKLELELLQTQVKLQEQLKKTNNNTSDDPAAKLNHSSKLLLKPEVAKQLLSNKKDESAKAMIAQINQRFPVTNTSILTQKQGMHPPKVNNSVGTGTTRPPIRDPRLIRQQATERLLHPPAPLVPLPTLHQETDNSNNALVDNKVNNKFLGRESRFDTKDEHNDQPKGKISSRIPLKSKRSSSPSKSKSSRHTKSSGSTSSLDSPTKSSRSSSKSPSKSTKSNYKSKTTRSTDKRTSKRSDRRSPKKDKSQRNYRRERAISISPEPTNKMEDDCRITGPTEKQARINADAKHEKDFDSRKCGSIGSKKRLSSETIEAPNSKKNRAEIFDALFGSEDNSRKLSNVDRPITPPAPIISNKPKESTAKENKNGSQEPEAAPKLSLEVLRAKLANATNANKDYLQKSRLQAQADQQKIKLAKIEDNKIFITSAEEETIKSGKMTKAQESSLFGKVIAQIENQKIKEAKLKENEENLNNMMTQPISDDEFDSDLDAKKSEDTISGGVVPSKHSRFEPVRFNREPQWKGGNKRGGFAGNRGNVRGRADPWIRPIHQGPQWNPAIVGSAFEEISDIKIEQLSMDVMVNNSPPHTALDDVCMSHENIKSINIDGEPRDILFYGETAIAFMSPEDPREISFQAGQRRVSFDDMHSYLLAFNDPYRDVLIAGHCHRVRLGAPTREIYIDGKPYECIFGGPPIAIELDRKLVMVHIEGPAPQVKIGATKRTDLVVGKVNLIIDAKTILPIYLDARTQTFDVDGTINTLRFKDALQTVLINEQPYNLEFGGLPKGVMVNGRKHFIRFSVLPKGVRAGYVNIRDMEGAKALSDNENSQDATDLNFGSNGGQQHAHRPRKSRFTDSSPDRNQHNPILSLLQQPSFGNLDSLLSIASSVLPTIPSRNTSSYQIEQPPPSICTSLIEPAQQLPQIPTSNPQLPPINTTVPPPITVQPPPAINNSVLNINDLFQKLVATGIVTSLQNPPTSSHPALGQPEIALVGSPQMSQHEEVAHKPNKHEVQIKPISFDDTSSLKVRQSALIQELYAGMQCSSCGMRFAQENSSLYSQHLDWHFRQNRKGKKNIRKASSRRWYYSIADWSNYEEIEDLEEREKCYFENQQKDQTEGQNEDNDGEIEIPSVPTDSNIPDARCEVCQEKFEQFYNEEKEEWHLRMAMRIEDKTYHPLCYEDYQELLANLNADESLDKSAIIADIDMKEEPTTIPGLDVEPDEPPVIIDFDSSESKSNTPKPEIEETDDVNLETKTESQADGEEKDDNAERMDADDDVIINEVEPEKIVLDDYEFDENGLIAGVVVKQEPVDDGFTDIENFRLGTPEIKEDVTTPQDETFVDIGVISEPAVPVSTPSTVEPTTTEEIIEPSENREIDESSAPATLSNNEPLLTVPSIDGNLDCNAGAVPLPTGGMSGKIKINISKPLPVIAPKENKDNTSDVDNNIEPIDPTQPLPPGEEPVHLHLKPALQGIDLKQLPPVNKGSELTGLCSIM